MPETRFKGGDMSVPNSQEQKDAFRIQQNALSVSSGNCARRAIRNLAEAAACEELIQDGSHSENQLWFVVRALCAEHGLSYDQYVTLGRNRAMQIRDTA